MSPPWSEHDVLSEISQAIITIRGLPSHCPLAKPHHHLLLVSLRTSLSWNAGPGYEKLLLPSSLQSPAPCSAACSSGRGGKPGVGWGL